MPPASNEEQFKFLISCIRWSNSGKVTFIAISTRPQTDISRSISEKSQRNVALSQRVLRKSKNSSFPVRYPYIYFHLLFRLSFPSNIQRAYSYVVPICRISIPFPASRALCFCRNSSFRRRSPYCRKSSSCQTF